MYSWDREHHIKIILIDEQKQRLYNFCQAGGEGFAFKMEEKVVFRSHILPFDYGRNNEHITYNKPEILCVLPNII